MRLKYTAYRLIQENSQYTVGGHLIWYDNANVRMWIILNINCNPFHHLAKSQMCAGALGHFSGSEPHSGTLCDVFNRKWAFCTICISIRVENILFLAKIYFSDKVLLWVTQQPVTLLQRTQYSDKITRLTLTKTELVAYQSQ